MSNMAILIAVLLAVALVVWLAARAWCAADDVPPMKQKVMLATVIRPSETAQAEAVAFAWSRLHLDDAPLGRDRQSGYVGKYYIAGVHLYVANAGCVFGWARPEPDNQVNNRAIAIFTVSGSKVGYISEKELQDFYTETGGTKVPVIIEVHHSEGGKLYGNAYTFTNASGERGNMLSLYNWFLDTRREQYIE